MRTATLIKLLAVSLLIPGLLAIAACRQVSRSSSVNISQTFEEGRDRPDVDLRVHVISDTSAHIYARMPVSQIGMLSSEGNRKPAFRWGLFAGFEAGSPLDTGRFSMFPAPQETAGDFAIFKDTMYFSGKGEFNLHFRIINAMGKEHEYMTVFRVADWGSSYNVLPLDPAGRIRFHDYVTTGDTILPDLAGNRPGEPVHVEYYRYVAKPAPPPFSTGSSRDVPGNHPDSTFTLDEGGLIAGDPGFYRIILDPAGGNGYTVSVFEKGFPFITTPTQMIECTRYIMTWREYQECIGARDQKAAIDVFWLNICGNMVRARKQMAQYYAGVELANMKFTNYIEGWKTDRGMMYIVLGRPDVVYRSAAMETWIYGEAGYSRSLTLNFTRGESSFNTSEFDLERIPLLKDSWYNAVNNLKR